MSVLNQDWLLVDDLAPSIKDDELGELYRGAQDGLLVLPFCPRCGLPLELDQTVCDGCGTTGTDWHAVEPRGYVHSVTVVHRLEPGLLCAEHPYPVADIELASGHRVVLTSVEPTSDPPAIDDVVSIAFRRVGGVAVPAYYRLVPPSGEVEESR